MSVVHVQSGEVNVKNEKYRFPFYFHQSNRELPLLSTVNTHRDIWFQTSSSLCLFWTLKCPLHFTNNFLLFWNLLLKGTEIALPIFLVRIRTTIMYLGPKVHGIIKLESNLVIRNFLVTLKLLFNFKCSLFLWNNLAKAKVTQNGSLTPICSSSNRSLSPWLY